VLEPALLARNIPVRHESARPTPCVPQSRDAPARPLDLYRHAVNTACRGSKNPSLLLLIIEPAGRGCEIPCLVKFPKSPGPVICIPKTTDCRGFWTSSASPTSPRKSAGRKSRTTPS
jgi:hypothetical protein